MSALYEYGVLLLPPPQVQLAARSLYQYISERLELIYLAGLA